MDYGIVVALLLLLCFACFFILYEKKNLSVKHISLIATLSAVAGISRVPFAALPNVQPTTFLVIVSGYSFGPFFGFMIGAMAALVSNMFLGQGPWTLWQMLAWGIIGFISGMLRKVIKKPSRMFLSLFAFVCGFLFDYIMNLWYWLFFVRPLTIGSFLAAYATSFYFDLLHGGGNFAFAYVLGNDFITLLSRFAAKLSYRIVSSEKGVK